jgi:ABC-type nitrate/sulfonate/bicarbonate transport system substrate-binding protein
MTRVNRRRLMKLGASAALGAGVVGSASAFVPRARAQTPQTVRVGYLPVNVELAVYSDRVNLWKEEGLDVQFVRADGGPAILQAVATGDLPVGDFGLAPAVVSATRGFPFYFLTLMTIATPDQPLDRIMYWQTLQSRIFRTLAARHSQ